VLEITKGGHANQTWNGVQVRILNSTILL